MSLQPRRQTSSVLVGSVPVGSWHPIVVQSMTNTDTADAGATAAQVVALAQAGSELVRVTVNTDEAAAAVPEIVDRVTDAGLNVPLVGDFHYNGHLLLARHERCAAALDKYRINPGNVGSRRRDENFRTIIDVARAFDKPVRIGVNWGSLDQDLLTAMMDGNAALSEPRDARDVYIDAMVGRAGSAPRYSPRSPDWVTTGSSCRPRSRRLRTWWRSTGAWQPGATTRSISA